MHCIICELGEIRTGEATETLQRAAATSAIKGVPAVISDNCREYYLIRR